MSRVVGIAAALAALPILVVVLALGAIGGTPAAAMATGTPTSVTSVAGLPHVTAPSKAAATAIAYAEQQLGKPYLFGGTGPDAFDCSGLVMMAYQAAGVSIPRTSQDQWTAGPQVSASQVEPGDLVFFAGSDGTATSPGHVGIIIDPATHLMIEAYATGFPIRASQFGTAMAAAGDGVVVGFTRPWAH